MCGTYAMYLIYDSTQFSANYPISDNSKWLKCSPSVYSCICERCKLLNEHFQIESLSKGGIDASNFSGILKGILCSPQSDYNIIFLKELLIYFRKDTEFESLLKYMIKQS